jgi:hypothetical protein
VSAKAAAFEQIKKFMAGAQPARKRYSRQNSPAILQIRPQFPEKQETSWNSEPQT